MTGVEGWPASLYRLSMESLENIQWFPRKSQNVMRSKLYKYFLAILLFTWKMPWNVLVTIWVIHSSYQAKESRGRLKINNKKEYQYNPHPYFLLDSHKVAYIVLMRVINGDYFRLNHCWKTNLSSYFTLN